MRMNAVALPEHPPDLGGFPVEPAVNRVPEGFLFAELHLNVECVDLDDPFRLVPCRLLLLCFPGGSC